MSARRGGGDVAGLALEIKRQPHTRIGIALLRFQILLKIVVLRFQKLIPLLRPCLRETGDIALFVEIERRRDLGKAGVALGIRETFGVGQVGIKNLAQIVGGYLRGIQTLETSRISTIFLSLSSSVTLPTSAMAFW